MKSRRSIQFAILATILVATPAFAQVDSFARCHAARLKLVAKYASCLLKEDAKAAVKPAPADHASCDAKMQAKWALIESKFHLLCPETNAPGLVQDIVGECTSDVLVPPASYYVTFGVTTAATIGTLQIEVDYNGADADIPGSGGSASCTNLVSGAIFASTDDDMAKTISLGIVDFDGATMPADVFRCQFDRSVYGLLRDSDLSILVTDATDPAMMPISVSVAVSSIQAIP